MFPGFNIGVMITSRYNMENIPQHCIEIFKDKFGSYPSLVEYSPILSKDDIDRLLRKSELIWYQECIDEKKDLIPRHKLYEYDPSGILIYVKYIGKIFILTKVDKKGVVNYVIQQLNKNKIK